MECVSSEKSHVFMDKMWVYIMIKIEWVWRENIDEFLNKNGIDLWFNYI